VPQRASTDLLIYIITYNYVVIQSRVSFLHYSPPPPAGLDGPAGWRLLEAVAHQPVFGHCQATIPHIAVLPVRCSPAVIQNASLCKCRSTWHFSHLPAHLPCPHAMPLMSCHPMPYVITCRFSVCVSRRNLCWQHLSSSSVGPFNHRGSMAGLLFSPGNRITQHARAKPHTKIRQTITPNGR
jgi:hypothetical protein